MQPFVGKIELIVGPMFAGKTTEMLRRVARAELAHRRCIVMKYSKDNRYSQENVSTHDLEQRKAIPCNELLPHLEECMTYDVIGVDEGQFFPDIVPFSDQLANIGKTVIVAGLDGTFQRKPFGQVLQLISRCETLTKLTAVCTITGMEAPYSARIVQSNDIELIGGSETYRAASRSAFFDKSIKGEIHLTIGPVQSGKTTEVLRILNRHHIAGKKPLFIMPSGVAPLKKIPPFKILETDTLPDLASLEEYDVIGIDEAQNYENLTEWADNLANNGKLVVVSALDGDTKRNAYPEIIKLFPCCEKVNKLDSICPITGLPAPFNIETISEAKVIKIPISRVALLQRALGSL